MATRKRASRKSAPAGEKTAPVAGVRPPRVSPLAPPRFPVLPVVAGVRLAVGSAGIARRIRHDLLLVDLADGTTVAGALTRSKTRSA
ncbi:MAG: bifunctional ornithine acetyltransferase/N-acetylglutamate synthase, partial [Proteobacteria bacterium]|nr:bifunctional ornithine acetyltransferase/N-acetylglutamate synthase [Pseudomonadota bacterium]